MARQKKMLKRVQFSGYADIDQAAREYAQRNNVDISDVYRFLTKSAVNAGALSADFNPAGIPQPTQQASQ